MIRPRPGGRLEAQPRFKAPSKVLYTFLPRQFSRGHRARPRRPPFKRSAPVVTTVGSYQQRDSTHHHRSIRKRASPGHVGLTTERVPKRRLSHSTAGNATPPRMYTFANVIQDCLQLESINSTRYSRTHQSTTCTPGMITCSSRSKNAAHPVSCGSSMQPTKAITPSCECHVTILTYVNCRFLDNIHTCPIHK